METPFVRSEMLLGKERMEKLKKARVAVFGLGGVGGYVVEALARSGVGALDLIDHDQVSISNLNRQILALHSTIGMYKADVAAARVKDINPACEVRAIRTFFLPENAEEFDFTRYSYVVDAIDTVTGKLEIIEQAHKAHVPVISAMGAGNKLDPTAFYVADLFETKGDPLARVMRRECKKRGITSLKVVCSTEPALTPLSAEAEAEPSALTESSGIIKDLEKGTHSESVGAPVPENADTAPVLGTKKRATPGSVAFVPSVCGLILAAEVVKDLTLTCVPHHALSEAES
ncbi:MAG: tRNA threonylcarbamoyladenosine dehydratase [Lachnospiraceae bacterium]|nr:tRNA threonylcarbamoyladenosine dehydratase [Lachnospiraceae bacterium]